MSPRDLLGALAVVLIWGLNFVAVKTGVSEFPPLMLTAVRFFAVALLVVPFFHPGRAQLGGIFLLSLTLGVGHFGLLFLGLSGVSAAAAAIAIQLCAPFSALLAIVFLRERLGAVPGFGMLLAFGGVALLAEEPSVDDPKALMLIVLAALAWSVSNLLIKRLGSIHPLTLNGWVALLAAPQLLALSLLTEHGQLHSLRTASWSAWGALAYTVLASSIIAYTIWYRLVAKYPLNRVVPFTLLGPVIGVAGGVLVLGETLSPEKIIGGVLTIIGVAVIELSARHIGITCGTRAGDRRRSSP